MYSSSQVAFFNGTRGAGAANVTEHFLQIKHTAAMQAAVARLAILPFSSVAELLHSTCMCSVFDDQLYLFRQQGISAHSRRNAISSYLAQVAWPNLRADEPFGLVLLDLLPGLTTSTGGRGIQASWPTCPNGPLDAPPLTSSTSGLYATHASGDRGSRRQSIANRSLLGERERVTR